MAIYMAIYSGPLIEHKGDALVIRHHASGITLTGAILAGLGLIVIISFLAPIGQPITIGVQIFGTILASVVSLKYLYM